MSAPLADVSNDPILEALWARILEAWNDDAAHAALLDYALRERALPEIARRYNALVDDPEKERIAKRKIDGIVLAATQTLLSTKTPKPGKVPPAIALSALALCALMLGWVALAIWGKP